MCKNLIKWNVDWEYKKKMLQIESIIEVLIYEFYAIEILTS